MSPTCTSGYKETGDTTAVPGTVCCIEETASFGPCPAGSECSLGLTCFPKTDYIIVGKCGSSSSPKQCCQKTVAPSESKKDALPEETVKKRIAPTAPPTDLRVLDPLTGADFPTIIGRVIATFLGMVGAISLVVFVYAGVRYLTAGGNEQSVTTAKDTMKYAFFGLVIILFAYVITNFFFEALTK